MDVDRDRPCGRSNAQAKALSEFVSGPPDLQLDNPYSAVWKSPARANPANGRGGDNATEGRARAGCVPGAHLYGQRNVANEEEMSNNTL